MPGFWGGAGSSGKPAQTANLRCATISAHNINYEIAAPSSRIQIRSSYCIGNSYYDPAEANDNTAEIIIAKQRQGESNKIIKVRYETNSNLPQFLPG